MSENFNKCPICSNNAKLPIATLCGHIFCWECVKNRGNINGILNCPVCNSPINLNEVVKLYTGDNQTKDGKVDDRPKQKRSKAEYVNSSFFHRIGSNFGLFDSSNEMHAPTRREVQTNIISLIIFILGFVFIFYIFSY